LFVKQRQVALDGFPHDGKVHREIAVRQGIAHFVGKTPRNGSVLRGKIGVVFGNVVAGFANDFQVANHGIAGLAVCHESGQVHAVVHS
jgi:hypothetical protein